MIKKTRKECIECNECRSNCLFLNKYDIHLKDFTYREDLRYHCFLCNKCQYVCPKDLSGADISMELRKKNMENTWKVSFLKDPYKFRNNSKIKSDSLLFLGCNYPGFYPKTSRRLIELSADRNIDFSIDCCKKPVLDTGKIMKTTKLKEFLKKKSTKRLICVCPNCYHLLKSKLDIEVISVFKWIREEKLGQQIKEIANIFFPCSDRYQREIFEDIKPYLTNYKEFYEKINCCGLGGNAMKRDPDLLEQTKEMFLSHQQENIYTYCSSCSGIFHRYGLSNIKNLVSEILGVKEGVSNTYAKNVIQFMFKRRRNHEI